ncbi:MAG: sulfite oxidase [Gemmataceae bacterium]
MNRRQLLQTASVASVAAVPLFSRRLLGQSPPSSEPGSSGQIVRMQEPRNLETAPEALVPFHTANDQFYVRSHFAVPKIDLETYRLKVTGHVENELSLSLKDIRETAKTTQPLTLECAGNGRVFLSPPVPGLQWGNGGISTANWSGIPLGAILKRAKVKAGAVDVILGGADQGVIAGPPGSPGPIRFERSLPLAKAKKDECLLATEMNGEKLTPHHGAPVRAVIGGWYGMASVKWLTTIVVTDRAFNGFFQSLDYSIFDRSHGSPTLVPLTAALPKAIILKPGLNSTIPANQTVTVSGKAWAGERKIAKVEISDDSGKTWATAKLQNGEKAFCWRDWVFPWKTPTQSGPISLLAKCTDDQGNTQAATRNPDRRSYAINHLIPVEFVVK